MRMVRTIWIQKCHCRKSARHPRPAVAAIHLPRSHTTRRTLSELTMQRLLAPWNLFSCRHRRSSPNRNHRSRNLSLSPMMESKSNHRQNHGKAPPPPVKQQQELHFSIPTIANWPVDHNRLTCPFPALSRRSVVVKWSAAIRYRRFKGGRRRQQMTPWALRLLQYQAPSFGRNEWRQQTAHTPRSKP